MHARAFPVSNMTGRSTVRSHGAALGVRCHSGWAAFVVLAGSFNEPKILERGRMALCDAEIEGSKQPFHTAEGLPFPSAAGFIESCSASTARLAELAIEGLVARHGRIVGCCVLAASARPLPGLAGLLASHSLIHAAEGEFYREAISAAVNRIRIPIQRVRERDLETAADTLLAPSQRRKALLEGFGRQVGPPWTQDEKRSALAAWIALAPPRTGVRPARGARTLEGP